MNGIIYEIPSPDTLVVYAPLPPDRVFKVCVMCGHRTGIKVGEEVRFVLTGVKATLTTELGESVICLAIPESWLFLCEKK
jgi:hypothetical protein